MALAIVMAMLILMAMAIAMLILMAMMMVTAMAIAMLMAMAMEKKPCNGLLPTSSTEHRSDREPLHKPRLLIIIRHKPARLTIS